MNEFVISDLMQNVFIAALAAVGIMETLKNFIKTEKTWIYSVIMIPVSIGCYLACLLLPKAVIGCILAVGVTQDCYTILVQTFQALVKAFRKKAGIEDGDKKNG